MSVILTLSNEGINDDVRNVYSVLEEKGKTIFHFKANCCLGGEYIEFRSMKGIPNLYAVIDGQEVNLMDIDAVWYHKPHLPKNLRLMQPPEYRPFVSKQFRSLWESLAGLLADKIWVSPYWNMIRAENKPHQLAIANNIGFEVPETLITSNPDKVREFWKYCGGEMVVKMLGTAPMDDKVIYTTKLTDKEMKEIDSVKLSPAIFQQWISKKFELRITVVGDKVFAVAIDSQSCPGNEIDWRHQNKNLKIRPYKIPEIIKDKCIELTKRFGLRMGCIDMIVTPDNRYVFLEINPNGQWGWVEKETGMPIAKAIAELFCMPSEGR